MGKLLMPGQAPAPKPATPEATANSPANFAKISQSLKNMPILQLYDLLDSIDEREHREYYWRVNHEIARRKIDEDKAALTESRELRASINLLKLAIEDLIGHIRAADVVPLQEGLADE